MNQTKYAAGLLLAGLCSCSLNSPAPGASSQRYDAVVIQGSQTSGDQFIKINKFTGETWIHTSGSKNNKFYLIADKIAPPPGEYRIVSWSQAESDGTVYWDIYRFDARNGHTWLLRMLSEGVYNWYDINTAVGVL